MVVWDRRCCKLSLWCRWKRWRAFVFFRPLYEWRTVYRCGAVWCGAPLMIQSIILSVFWLGICLYVDATFYVSVQPLFGLLFGIVVPGTCNFVIETIVARTLRTLTLIVMNLRATL